MLAKIDRWVLILRLAIILVMIALVCTLISGCAIFSKDIDRAAKGAGKMVRFYCENVPELSVREKFREKVNYNAAPHSIKVTCAGDNPPPPLVTTGTPP